MIKLSQKGLLLLPLLLPLLILLLLRVLFLLVLLLLLLLLHFTRCSIGMERERQQRRCQQNGGARTSSTLTVRGHAVEQHLAVGETVILLHLPLW